MYYCLQPVALAYVWLCSYDPISHEAFRSTISNPAYINSYLGTLLLVLVLIYVVMEEHLYYHGKMPVTHVSNNPMPSPIGKQSYHSFCYLRLHDSRSS